MTSKEILPVFDRFIKEHSADEFNTCSSALSHLLTLARAGIPLKRQNIRRETITTYGLEIRDWWFKNKAPLSEENIIKSLDVDMVTHGWVGWASRFNGGGMMKSNAILKLADFSFKFNIIGIQQEPGHLHLYFRESSDYQTNITGEVIDRIDKCLDF